MLEKLSEQELQFIEDFYYPVATSEMLFSDYDNMTVMEETKLAHIRKGQIPLLSFEYMLDNDETLTDKQNFQLRKGSGDTYVLGGRLFGKCEDAESFCLLANGSYVQYKDLVGTSQKVVSLNTDNLKLEISEAKFYDNGKKDCWKIILKSGKEVTITQNHPLLTDLGWKKCEELKVNDFIATPRKYPIEGDLDIDENIPKLLGYLIGDGGCTQNQISFTNTNSELIEDFLFLVKYFGCDYRKKDISYIVKRSNNFRRKQYIKGVGYIPGEGRKSSRILELVRKYKINTLSKYKEIPDEVFLWKNKYVAILLNRLFACDGTVTKQGNLISYCSASKKLVQQIISLLLRFGIHSRLSYKKSKCKDKYFDSWFLVISKDRDKFVDLIGIKSKDFRIKKNSNNLSPSIDRLPKSFIQRIYSSLPFKKLLNLKSLLLYNPTLDKVKRLNQQVKNTTLDILCNSDIYWDVIEKIEYVGQKNTIAVSVPKYENYISNNIISHNTLCVEKIDFLISVLLLGAERCGFSSYDAIHIRGVLEDIIQVLDHHPIYRLYNPQITRSPNYRFYFSTGYLLESVNMNIQGKNPGKAFFQKHFTRLYIEEASMETEEVYKLRRDSVSENGCVFRVAGMTNFTKYSPCGRIFYDMSQKGKVINLPQYSNPKWDSKSKEQAVKDFAGEASIGFRVFIKGEVVEEGISVFDMQRVRQHYLEDKYIKTFEVDKQSFGHYLGLVVVEKPKNAQETYIFADIGESAPTKIGIIFKVNDKYRYVYKITLYNLTDKEQFKFFRWLSETLSANYIAIDTTDGTGRSIYRSLEEIFTSAHLVWAAFNEKIPIDFEKDEKGNILFKDGKPLYVEEYVSDWSIKHLKDLLYQGSIELPIDYELDQQLNSVVSMQSGTRTIYSCINEENHLFQAFQVFSIAHWQKEFSLLKPVKKTGFCKTGVG